jgi:hypothetical protein
MEARSTNAALISLRVVMNALKLRQGAVVKHASKLTHGAAMEKNTVKQNQGAVMVKHTAAIIVVALALLTTPSSYFMTDTPSLPIPSTALPATTLKIGDEAHSIPGMALVINFWAQPKEMKPGQKEHHHVREIKSAMVTNLLNRHFRQVVVILDSVSGNTSSCGDFVHQITQQRDKEMSRISPFVDDGMMRLSLPQLDCIEREDPLGQPTYREMFEYAVFHPVITADLIILSNPDQVFDDTIAYAENMPNNTIFVLSTQGYNTSILPIRIRNMYQSLVGDDAGSSSPSRCVHHYDSVFSGQSLSWDAYVFHRSLLRVDTSWLRNKSSLQRLDFDRVPQAYFMNENGAEAAALHDMVTMLVNVSVWNACKLIQMWDFHLAEKMHHTNDDNGSWPRFIDVTTPFYNDDGRSIPKSILNGVHSGLNETELNTGGCWVPRPWLFGYMCLDQVSCYSHSDSANQSVTIVRWPF